MDVEQPYLRYQEGRSDMKDLMKAPLGALHPVDNVDKDSNLTQADEALRRVTGKLAPTATRVLERFPAGGPRGSWPAEEYAAARRNEGINATVVMDLTTDTFLVKAVA